MTSSNGTGQAIQLKVKLILDTEIQQWRYPMSNQYDSLIAFVQTSFHINDFLLQFSDDEGDRLTIASERDLKDAYSACKQQFRRSLRIFIIAQKPANKRAEPLFNDTSADPIEFHWGSACSQCQSSPIQGIRYKCCICSNFDLCPHCQSLPDIHDKSHPFIKLNIYKNKLSRFGVSAQNTQFVGLQQLLNNLGLCIQPQNRALSAKTAPNANSQRQSKAKTVNRRFANKTVARTPPSPLSAELICDLSLPDGAECVLDNIVTKKWRLRNDGDADWGYNVELAFFGGAQQMVLNKRVPVSGCPVGKNTEISLRVKIPQTEGKYTVFYKLYADNKPFGPTLHIDIMAVDKSKKKSVPSEPAQIYDAEQSIVFLNDANDGSKPRGRRLSMVLSRNVATVSCICGEYLMATRPAAVYGTGLIVFCKGCGVHCRANESIYHCSMDSNAVHPKGYDLCNNCYDARLRSAAQPVADEQYIGDGKEDVIMLSDVKKYISKIEELRNVFPRFYFLSNDDMIRLIRVPTPLNVEKYLSILFEGIVGFVLDEDNKNIILGLKALNGEVLRFGRLINAGKKQLSGSLDKWLLKIEYQMRYSMSILLEESFAEYGKIENSEKYFEWIGNYSTQIMLITKRCLWCKTIEFFLKNKNKNKAFGLHEALKETKAEINLLSGYVYKLIKNEENIDMLKSKIGALIQQLVYERDVTALLIKENVASADDEVWISKMRTYYHTDDNMLDQYNIFKKLYIKCNRKIYHYGYEFYGDIESFIYTRTVNTDTLFPSLLQTTIDNHNISNVYGHIGMGRIESLKVFAYSLGRPYKIFNANQSCMSDISRMNDSDRLFNWFAGISSCGGFGILKEADIKQFGGQISYYATSINYHLNENKNHMIINEKRIPLHGNTRIFIVTKKKYVNNDSNDIMSKIVQPFAMPRSNKISITHTLLSTNGFKNAEYLAKRMSMLLELCVSLYVVNQYDFGFKLIVQICSEAGEELVKYIQANKEENKLDDNDEVILIDDFEDDDALNNAIRNNNKKKDNVQQKEEEKLLINSIVCVMFGVLTQSDCILFESLVESAFSDNNIDWNMLISQSRGSSASVFEKELKHLKMIGFNNAKQCENALIKHNGNIELAMNELYSMRT